MGPESVTFVWAPNWGQVQNLWPHRDANGRALGKMERSSERSLPPFHFSWCEKTLWTFMAKTDDEKWGSCWGLNEFWHTNQPTASTKNIYWKARFWPPEKGLSRKWILAIKRSFYIQQIWKSCPAPYFGTQPSEIRRCSTNYQAIVSRSKIGSFHPICEHDKTQQWLFSFKHIWIMGHVIQ